MAKCIVQAFCQNASTRMLTDQPEMLHCTGVLAKRLYVWLIDWI
ncbi:MAG: hypothetical protein EDM05_012980 [Leptolyngbya sp. IPPAS B-1204]